MNLLLFSIGCVMCIHPAVLLALWVRSKLFAATEKTKAYWKVAENVTLFLPAGVYFISVGLFIKSVWVVSQI